MNNYLDNDNTLESNFRSIYLFGRNVATYKFAFAKTLLELGESNKSFVSLEELSPIFAKYMLEHIRDGKRQITSQSSKFISALNLFHQNQITWEQLLEVTEKVGFNNVIDAFHNIPNGELDKNFYEKSIQGKTLGITLTDSIFLLNGSAQKINILNEIEGRWNLVENAWTERNPKLEVQFDTDLEQFFFIKPMTPQQFMLSHERINLTSARKPLNGYQKGKCFYCYKPISIESNQLNTCDIDHFVPLSTQFNSTHDLDLNCVWNLVLSCQDCNRGEANGKFARLPEDPLLQRLYKRNEYLIESNHPLKETIIMRTGKNPQQRADFLKLMYRLAETISRAKWKPKLEYDIGF
ncbi:MULTISPECIES: HNH endonuclease domain-containing protein [Lysinibacillus]|uniref:HNH endonuclease domain-containing protein n=1 Tax=Lysinibacillus TaxID=400634 RepID=UPI00214BA219|nr:MULTISPECIES: HNH endonuclease domain-containing protein [Lysinibacillus]UUV26032.1 HNH endonuclease [Lysinibacillus sp. FN11]UYB48903.1 HNH endonuclease [Lysinibacillus capsici]